MEDSLDTQAVEAQRDALFIEIEKALPEDKLAPFVRRNLLFRLGKMTPWEYYSHLVDTASEVWGKGVPLESKYPSLDSYIQVIKEHSKMDVEGLISEITILQYLVKDVLFRNIDERKLDKTLYQVKLMRELMHLQWTRESFDNWNVDDISVNEVYKSLQQLSSNYLKSAWEISADELELLNECSNRALEFYRLALLRDKELLENALEAMRSRNQRCAVLVSGGFHSSGIVELIKQKGLDYVVLTPRITRIEEESPYLALMNDLQFKPALSNTQKTVIAYPSYTLIELLDKALAKEIEIDSISELLAVTLENDPAELEDVFSQWRKTLPVKYRSLLDTVMGQIRDKLDTEPRASGSITSEGVEKLIRQDEKTGELVLRYLKISKAREAVQTFASKLFEELYMGEASNMDHMIWKKRKRIPESVVKVKESRLHRQFFKTAFSVLKTLFPHGKENEVYKSTKELTLNRLSAEKIFFSTGKFIKKFISPTVFIGLGTFAASIFIGGSYSMLLSSPLFWVGIGIGALGIGLAEIIKQVRSNVKSGNVAWSDISWWRVLVKGGLFPVAALATCYLGVMAFPYLPLEVVLMRPSFWLLTGGMGFANFLIYTHFMNKFVSEKLSTGNVGLQDGKRIFIDFSLESIADFASVAAHEVTHRAQEMGLHNEVASMVDHLTFLKMKNLLGSPSRTGNRMLVRERLDIGGDPDFDSDIDGILQMEDPVEREAAIAKIGQGWDAAFDDVLWKPETHTLLGKRKKETPSSVASGLMAALYVDEKIASLNEEGLEPIYATRFGDLYIYLRAHLPLTPENLKLIDSLPEQIVREMNSLYMQSIPFKERSRVISRLIENAAGELNNEFKIGLHTLSMNGGILSESMREASIEELKIRPSEEELDEIIYDILAGKTDVERYEEFVALDLESKRYGLKAGSFFQPLTVQDIAYELDKLNINYGGIDNIEAHIQERVNMGNVVPVAIKSELKGPIKKGYLVRGAEDSLWKEGFLQRILRLDGSQDWLFLPDAPLLEERTRSEQKRIIDDLKSDDVAREDRLVPFYGIPRIKGAEGFAFDYCYYSEISEMINAGRIGVVHGRGRKGYYHQDMVDQMLADGLVIPGIVFDTEVDDAGQEISVERQINISSKILADEPEETRKKRNRDLTPEEKRERAERLRYLKAVYRYQKRAFTSRVNELFTDEADQDLINGALSIASDYSKKGEHYFRSRAMAFAVNTVEMSRWDGVSDPVLASAALLLNVPESYWESFDSRVVAMLKRVNRLRGSPPFQQKNEWSVQDYKNYILHVAQEPEDVILMSSYKLFNILEEEKKNPDAASVELDIVYGGLAETMGFKKIASLLRRHTMQTLDADEYVRVRAETEAKIGVPYDEKLKRFSEKTLNETVFRQIAEEGLNPVQVLSGLKTLVSIRDKETIRGQPINT
ncbi:MAG: hypothetical protein P9M03_04350, partial [Candidatus Theseobacter exili]|nr:hypothetical protein [Candidatus Theseobacter exili]